MQLNLIEMDINRISNISSSQESVINEKSKLIPKFNMLLKVK